MVNLLIILKIEILDLLYIRSVEEILNNFQTTVIKQKFCFALLLTFLSYIDNIKKENFLSTCGKYSLGNLQKIFYGLTTISSIKIGKINNLWKEPFLKILCWTLFQKFLQKLLWLLLKVHFARIESRYSLELCPIWPAKMKILAKMRELGLFNVYFPSIIPWNFWFLLQIKLKDKNTLNN